MFSTLEDQLRRILIQLSRVKLMLLVAFISNTLFIDHPEGKKTNIPQSPRELFNQLQTYWTKLSIDALMQLGDHLRDAAPQFKTMVVEYQQALHEFLRCSDVSWSQNIALRQPADYTTLVVRMNSSAQDTAAKAIGTLAFWTDKLQQIGSRSGISVILTGLTTDGTSLVFFVSELYIARLFQWAQQNMGIVHTEGIKIFTVPDQVTLNTGSGETVSLSIQSCILSASYTVDREGVFRSFKKPPFK